MEKLLATLKNTQNLILELSSRKAKGFPHQVVRRGEPFILPIEQQALVQ